MTARHFRVLPGFGLTMGYTLLYLSLIVLIPLSAAFLRSAELGPERFWAVVTTPRVLSALRLSFGAALLAALVNAVFGFIIAWSLVRLRFPGRRIVDAIIDLPFALPTAVAGIALTALYSANGWIGRIIEPLGFKVAYTPTGVVLALMFVGLPFIVRTLQPVIADLDRELEGAAETLGASRLQTFRWVVLPAIWPVMAIAILIRSLDLVRIFDIIWALTAGGPGTMTETISIYTYTQGFNQFETSYTAAMAFLVIAILTVIVTWAIRRMGLAK